MPNGSILKLLHIFDYNFSLFIRYVKTNPAKPNKNHFEVAFEELYLHIQKFTE